MAKRIKDTYQKHLWIFIAVNSVIFWSTIVYGLTGFDKIITNISDLVGTKSIFFILYPIVAIALNGIVPNSVKETLVFWRVRNRLPGHRAFSYFVKKDPRINIDSLKNKIGKFPEKPDEQNKVWYSIYQQYSNDELIWGSHRDFLLTRDLASLSFLFLLVFGTISIHHTNDFVSIYLLFLMIQYIVLSFSARNYGNRFVCNVLAKASIINSS